MYKGSEGEAVFGEVTNGVGFSADARIAFDRNTARKEWRKRRIILFVIAALGVFSVTEFARGIYLSALDENALPGFLLAVLSSMGTVFAVMVARRSSTHPYEADASTFFISLSDRYTKRAVNAIYISFFLLATCLLSEWSFHFLGNTRMVSFAKRFADTFPIAALGFFSVSLNILLLRDVHCRMPMPERGRILLHIVSVFLFSALYWAIVAILLSSIGEGGKVFPISSVLFFLYFLTYNVTLRKRLTHDRIFIDKKRLAVLLVALLLVLSFSLMNRDTWYMQPYINSVSAVPHGASVITYDDIRGVYTLTALRDEFKILHLTDIHLGGSYFSREKDILALRACYREIAYTRPDLVIVTGDLTYPIGVTSFSFNNSAPIQQFAAFMRNVGIPWAFVYGNHDTESIASKQEEEIAEVYKSLSFKTSGTLLYPYVQPAVTGRNNQVIEVRNADGSLNTALFLLDSNAYSGEGFNKYDYIHDDQVAWYEAEVRRLQEEEGGDVSSLAFFHIPLQEYRTAYELYLDGSEEVIYHFGENNETMINKICCSEHPSSLFDRIVALGSTTGVFCGHDHYNNMSLSYQGVRLTYGMSIDYLVMPGISEQTAQRGAELITINGDSSWSVKQIPLTAIE